MSTTLEILAPYLPYGIDVVYDALNDSPTEGRLHMLDYHGYATAMQYGASVASAVSLDDCLPVLRSFADLCTPLADGTVPAVEAAKIQWPLMRAPVKAIWMPEKTQGYVLDEYGLLLVYFTQNFYDNELSVKTFNYLRSKHFAVGLTADQYIQKV